MDDPWGSPWAEESFHSLPNSDDKSTKQPVTPGNALSSQPAQPANSSPWGDDDGFGDWAAAPLSEESNTNNSKDANISATGWGVEPTETDLEDGSEHKIRETWFTRETASAAVENGTPKSALFDASQGSHDPWAGAVSDSVEKEHEAVGDTERTGSDSTVTPTAPDVTGDLEDHTIIERGEDAGKESTADIEQVKHEEVVHLNSDDTQAALVENANFAAADAENSQTELKDSAHNDLTLSRPSSSPSDHSQHDEIVESPRTSFEEEPKRPKLNRDGSSKVKDLVQLFDGLAVPEPDFEPIKKVEGGNGAEASDGADDDFGDFGDFEEGSSHDRIADESSATTEKLASVVALEDNNETAQSHVPTQPVLSSNTTNPESSNIQDGSLEFKIDLSTISKVLYEAVQSDQAEHLDDRSLGIDNVQEPFSTIEERKVWYRISRYGTMRKHNNGDEDYVRINWGGSRVREETLKLVSKWMEEDRIGGGVILGGGNRLESMFGWGDKNGAPLTLESAFAARKAQRRSSRSRSRKSSLNGTAPDGEAQGSSEHRRSRSSQSSVSKQKGSIEMPAATAGPHFGWSTSQPTSAVSETVSPVIPLSNSRQAQPQVMNGKLSTAITPRASKALPISQQNAVPMPLDKPLLPVNDKDTVAKTTRPAPISVPVPRSMFEADDEWGEMVSSPAIDGTNDVASNQLGHKSTRSVVNILSPILSSNASTPRNSQGQMVTNSVMLSPGPIVNNFSALVSSQPLNRGAAGTESSSNAWESADFSFFDTSSTSTVRSVPPKQPSVPQNIIVLPPHAPQQRVTSKVRPAPFQMSSKNLESEEEKTVRSIVKNLPDLSYMLRR